MVDTFKGKKLTFNWTDQSISRDHMGSSGQETKEHCGLNTRADCPDGFLKEFKFQDSASKSIVDQGFVLLKELKKLGGTDVENLCKVIRKTGGTKSSVSSSRSTADHESSVPILAENNLKLTCYFVRHKMERVSRTFTQGGVTMELALSIKKLKKQEEDYEEPKKEDYPIIKKTT
eukprot:3021918-Ditylum_brightwellii.AAC.1